MFFGKASLGLALTVLLLIGVASCDNNATFPSNFSWGVASAAYQIEGGYNADDKGLSIWDIFSHIPNTTFDNQTGDVADDFYHLYDQDIKMMASLGVKNFRMSLSWPRLLPNGTVDVETLAGSSAAGIAFYNKVFASLNNSGITPWVTLYHWDLPANFSTSNLTGGWLNPNMSFAFRDYAEFCFKTFGQQVKHWLTFNEISTYAFQGYGTGAFAPGRCSDARCNVTGGGGNTSTEPYIVTHNSLVAHALAVDVYKSSYQAVQNGTIGLTINSGFSLPWNPNDPLDHMAAERSLQFNFGWFGNPIINGDYPQIMKDLVGNRLPNFTDYQKKLLKGSFDFVGINYYTSNFVKNRDTPGDNWGNDGQADGSSTDAFNNSIGPTADSTWLQVYPAGLGSLLKWIVNTYSLDTSATPFYIFENGVSVPGESKLPLDQALNDTFRTSYIRDHLSILVQTMLLDNINIQGYFCWSIIDNYEWASGVSVRFGLVYVDYDNNLTRHAKSSAYWYKDVMGNLTGGQDLQTALNILATESPSLDSYIRVEDM